jgi:hypothetical protein
MSNSKSSLGIKVICKLWLIPSAQFFILPCCETSPYADLLQNKIIFISIYFFRPHSHSLNPCSFIPKGYFQIFPDLTTLNRLALILLIRYFTSDPYSQPFKFFSSFPVCSSSYVGIFGIQCPFVCLSIRPFVHQIFFVNRVARMSLGITKKLNQIKYLFNDQEKYQKTFISIKKSLYMS